MEDDKQKPVLDQEAFKAAMQKRMKGSAQSQWIGLLVLGFGALCLIAVGVLIFQPMHSAEQEPQTTAQKTSNQNPQNTQAWSNKQIDERNKELDASIRSIERSSKKIKGDDRTKQQAAVEYTEIRGAWQTILKRSTTGILDISRDGYRMIIGNDSPNAYRYYSFGTFDVLDGNVLVFYPQKDAIAPNDGFKYRQLYTKPFSMSIKRQGEYQIWTRAPAGGPIVNPSSHPLLRLAQDGIVLWKKF